MGLQQVWECRQGLARSGSTPKSQEPAGREPPEATNDCCPPVSRGHTVGRLRPVEAPLACPLVQTHVPAYGAAGHPSGPSGDTEQERAGAEELLLGAGPGAHSTPAGSERLDGGWTGQAAGGRLLPSREQSGWKEGTGEGHLAEPGSAQRLAALLRAVAGRLRAASQV
uniref:Uncharacterized protein n=1 Tax=Rangifer tarandus platyrhynchus TaxID=3082113 RepID=A0ACB0F6T7_RANTA|nr:unnamed protein product [Rangifer tarandus platyrhynchus]